MKTYNSIMLLSLREQISNRLFGALVIGFTLCLSFISLPALAASTGMINLLTEESGMHRISYEELRDGGADLAGLKHGRFSLRSGSLSVPILTKGQDKKSGSKRYFGEGGYIQFYADAVDSLYSTKRAYTLHYGVERIEFSNERTSFKPKKGFVENYRQTDVFEENTYFDYLAVTETDPWHYGQTFVYKPGDNQGPTVNFNLEDLVGDTADINVEIYGLRDTLIEANDHHAVAKVNSIEVGDEQFDGFSTHVMQLSEVPVAETGNDFTLYGRSISTVPFDAIGLNKLVIAYLRATVAQADYLEGYFDGAQIKTSGFSDNTAQAYRRDSDGGITRLLRPKEYADGLGFNTNGISGNYIVVADNGYKTPGFSQIHDDQNISAGGAEYLIISNAAFMGAELDELVLLRSQEYGVKVVDVEQIYGQFGSHVPSADAIRDYIKYAVDNLGTRFVVLVGSDTYDYKNHITESISFIPTTYVSTPGGGLQVSQTPSDAAYGDLDGDSVPDIPIGRFSVRTKQELGYVVEKLRDYQAREGYAGQILIAGDKEDAGNGISFADDVADMIAAIPSEWSSTITPEYRALPDVDGDQAAHDKITAAINAGVAVTAYIGHSSQQVWARTNPKLLRSSEIEFFNNIDKPTLVTQWGCWNTYFVDPDGNNMADLFLVGGLNGAATVLGASTLTTAAGERIFGVELNKLMFNQGLTIGEAVIAAKQAFAKRRPSGIDILLGWQIIGDPALKINP